ncbi:MAG: hypothetical protein NZ524_08335 [Thiobacillaceae bacterium]|nr:hypothetical protein [Thiobacillaceae bacterium]MDW8323934.1 hypothetical protein [Burkholderiales bacterium]
MTGQPTQVFAISTAIEDGQERICINLNGGPAVALTSSQARELANELIRAASRVEVKANLKYGHNFGRRTGEPRPRLALN